MFKCRGSIYNLEKKIVDNSRCIPYDTSHGRGNYYGHYPKPCVAAPLVRVQESQ